MVHPDINRVNHIPAVQRSMIAYRNTFRRLARTGLNDATTWAPLKEAENGVNEAVENAVVKLYGLRAA